MALSCLEQKTRGSLTLLSASPHQHIHTSIYHANVVDELYSADDISDGAELRDILRSIGGSLTRGQFPF